MEATVLLADWAEAINGKLYIQGAGWNQVVASEPLSCAVAVLLSVGWEEANTLFRVTVRLVNEDGEPVMPVPDSPVVIETMVEVGRPPGVRPGSDLPTSLAVRLVGVPLEPGRYQFVLEVDDTPIARGVTFDVV